MTGGIKQVAPSVSSARVEDLPALACGDIDRLGLLSDRLARRDAGKGELLVAWHEGEPAGHVYLWLEPAEEPELRERLPGVPLIMNLWVRDDLRNRGIGTALTARAERWLRARGHLRVALGVAPDNRHATRLYLRLDYEPWPYADLKTFREEYGPNGRVTRYPELCAVLVKDLPEVPAAEEPERARLVTEPPGSPRPR
ncbi:GNAT family N-acetyltransferase [Phytohabitans sp. ZYX-F-186]|uniref:GNAT family N-acetyltransferase n=1 Tax=Phytohabitans maris TaxID=3071409 RepID=A0ABU0Z9X7_9ACTN|nr:GNAT family N-acetyltransferase [Phytohabitans sp. ZYX-F-186]MDQ7903855.1 GNAT family N-acetyltransferase [Phytohabitans sp. ZYX-F-186]